MKALLALLFLIVLCSAFTACESDLPPDPNAQAPLRRGLSGQGSIVPVDHANDPMIKETSGPATN